MSSKTPTPQPSSPSPPDPTDTTTWEQISDILSITSQPNQPFHPTPADPNLLLPNAFATAIRKHHVAHQASLATPSENQTTSNSLPSQLVRQVLTALEQLRRHYHTLVSDPDRLRDAHTGFLPNTVLWLPPNAQHDFVSFINALWSRWGSPDVAPQQVSQLVDWASNPSIDHHLLQSGISESHLAYESLENAFRVFRLAFDDMLKLHNDVFPTDTS